jgi:hypothetical protein
MTFQPGTYYVGDPGFVLPNDDLRELFCGTEMAHFLRRYKVVEESFKKADDEVDIYWYCATPHKSGTLYDQDNKGWGFDWGCFGVFLGNGWTARGRMRATRLSLPSHLSVHLPKTVLQ